MLPDPVKAHPLLTAPNPEQITDMLLPHPSLSEKVLQVADARRKTKGKGERERHTRLNAGSHPIDSTSTPDPPSNPSLHATPGTLLR